MRSPGHSEVDSVQAFPGPKATEVAERPGSVPNALLTTRITLFKLDAHPRI
jgi:hypothetical protein